MPYDQEAVERGCAAGRAARAATRRARPGSGCTVIWSSAGSTAWWSRRGWCRSGRVIGSRPTAATRASWRALLAGGLLEPIHRALAASWRPPAIWCVRARTRAWIGCATGTGCRSSACATGGGCRRAAGRDARRKWLAEQRFELPGQQQTFDTYLHAVDLVDARIEAARAGDPRDAAEQGPWRELVARLRCLRGIDTLTALGLVGRDRRLQPLQDRRGVHGLRRARALRALLRRAAPAGLDHQGRQQPRPPAAGRVGLARAPPADASATSSPAANAARTPP